MVCLTMSIVRLCSIVFMIYNKTVFGLGFRLQLVFKAEFMCFKQHTDIVGNGRGRIYRI